jgi:hypothetical protein
MTWRIDENNRDWTQTWIIENQLKQATAGSDTVTFTLRFLRAGSTTPTV